MPALFAPHIHVNVKLITLLHVKKKEISPHPGKFQGKKTQIKTNHLHNLKKKINHVQTGSYKSIFLIPMNLKIEKRLWKKKIKGKVKYLER